MNYDRDLMLEKVDAIGLPEDIVAALRKSGIEDVEGLCSCTRSDMIKMDGVYRPGMLLIESTLSRIGGLKLGMPLYFFREGRKAWEKTNTST